MTLAEEYFKYTKKYTSSHGDKTLVLMQVGSFFECYAMIKPDGSYEGSHIKEFSRINDMTISKKNICVGSLDVVMAGFGLPQLEKYVKKMLQHGFTVVVYTQDIQSKNTTRSLACIYSPGTFFAQNESIETCNNENNFNSGLSNNTICIWIHLSKANRVFPEDKITIGLSIIDILTGKLINYEYSHPYINSPTTDDQLEKYIAIYNPNEVILITNNTEEEYLDSVINFANITGQKFHKIILNEKNKIKSEFETIALNCEKQNYQEELIDKLYGKSSFNEKMEFSNYPIANQSLCFLIDFIEKHNPYLIKDIEYPIFENHLEKLVLANHSLKQLNIINDNRYNGKLSCVANFLNNCITNPGKRKFNYDLLHPISNIDSLKKSYDVVEHLIDNKFYDEIRKSLYEVRDIEKIERKLIMKNINPKDFTILYQNLSNISTIFQNIRDNNNYSILYNYIQEYIPYDIKKIADELGGFIHTHFDLDKSSYIIMDKLSNYDIINLDFISKNYSDNLNTLLKNSMDSREHFEAISLYLSKIISEFEKPKSGRTLKSKKKVEDDVEETEKSGQYVKIHETSKNDAMLILTKRRAAILKENIEKIIQKNGEIIDIEYKSRYTGENEILKFNIKDIEFKQHGNNQSNSIISSSQINKIAHTIQHSKDILIEGINKHYSDILRDFINFNDKTKLSTISKFIGLIDICHCKAYNADKFNYSKPLIQEIV